MSPRATTRPSAASITNTLRLLCTSSPTYDSIGLPSSLYWGAVAADPVVDRGPYRGGGQPAFIDTVLAAAGGGARGSRRNCRVAHGDKALCCDARRSPFAVLRSAGRGVRGRSVASRRLTPHVEASSIAIDVSASQLPQLPVPRHSPEQVGGYRATSAWLERYPLSQHADLREYAQDWFSGGQRNYSTVSRDPRHRL